MVVSPGDCSAHMCDSLVPTRCVFLAYWAGDVFLRYRPSRGKYSRSPAAFPISVQVSMGTAEDVGALLKVISEPCLVCLWKRSDALFHDSTRLAFIHDTSFVARSMILRISACVLTR